ncbi:MAG: aldo/keto reductase [Planctomycetota bacterium]|jgi:aryl-alcohol dehydrogenase-like predicted oxidoreductase
MTTNTIHPTLDRDMFRAFGGTGLHVSPLGFGGAPIGNLDTDLSVVRSILETLLDHGVNVIDTAHAYYGSEEAIGAAVSDRRDAYVLVSKCGSKWEEDDLPPAWTPEYVHATIDRSLRRLRTDRLDVMLLHSCDLATLQRGDVLDAVVEARDAGKVRFVGYSGDNEVAAWAAAHPEITVVQVSVSMCDQWNIDDVLPIAREHDVGVMAKRPVANGAWKTLEAQYERYRKYATPYHERFGQMGLELDALREACGAALDWPEIALRFTLSISGVHTAIVGTTNPDNLAVNLRAAARGPLPERAVQMIRDAYRVADPGRAWPGLT